MKKDYDDHDMMDHLDYDMGFYSNDISNQQVEKGKISTEKCEKCVGHDCMSFGTSYCNGDALENERKSLLQELKDKNVRRPLLQDVNFSDPVKLAQYLAELERQGIMYAVCKEDDGSHSVLITGH